MFGNRGRTQQRTRVRTKTGIKLEVWKIKAAHNMEKKRESERKRERRKAGRKENEVKVRGKRRNEWAEV